MCKHESMQWFLSSSLYSSWAAAQGSLALLLSFHLRRIVCAKVKHKRQLLVLFCCSTALLAIKILILCTICHRCHLERRSARPITCPRNATIPCKALGLSDYVDVDATTQSRPELDLRELAYLQLPGSYVVVVVAAAFVDNTLNSICIFSCPMKRSPHTRSTQTLHSFHSSRSIPVRFK